MQGCAPCSNVTLHWKQDALHDVMDVSYRSQAYSPLSVEFRIIAPYISMRISLALPRVIEHKSIVTLKLPIAPNMAPARRLSSSSSPEPAAKRRKRSPSATPLLDVGDAGGRFGDEYGSKWADWPAPRSQMEAASAFIRDM
jgi:hypothetical protein